MEAIGVVASIIGVAGAGAKLSIVLFEFASTVGSAGQEVRQIGIEISLFCSVLKQLQSTLTKAKACRYSLSAIETTQEILDRCQEIFKEIETIVVSLSSRKQNDERPSEATRKLIGKVKWTFKRSHVQLLRATLESCKVTLHIMLSTLEFAQKVATRRTSTIETEAEDEQDGTMTRSLIIAHQCTVDTLQRLEEEEQQQLTEGDLISPPITPETPLLGRILRAPTIHRPSRSIDNQSIRFPSPSKDLTSKRASVWINRLIFDNSPLPLGFRRRTWGDSECALFLDQQPYYFLQKWTDQGQRLSELRREIDKSLVENHMQGVLIDAVDKKTTPARTELLLNSAVNAEIKYQPKNLSTSNWNLGSIPEISSTQSTPHSISSIFSATFRQDYSDSIEIDLNVDAGDNDNIENQPLAIRKQRRRPPSRLHLNGIKQSDDSQQSTGRLDTIPTQPQNQILGPELFRSNGGVDILKFFRVSMEDPCYKVLPAALKKYNISAPWEQYALYIVYGGKERCLDMYEKPLILFKQLDQEGKKPMFMLRKIINEAMIDPRSLPMPASKHLPYNDLPGGIM